MRYPVPVLIVSILVLTFLFSSCSKKQRLLLIQQPAPPESTLAKVKHEIQELKTALAQKGKYSCCIQEPCNYCLFHEGSCPCYDEVKAGEHICIECYAGW